MTDAKFLDRIVPILVDRAISELTKKGHNPSNSGADKSLGGDIVRDLADRVVRELINKGYTPTSGSSDKFFPGIEIIAPVVIDRVLDQFTR